jgi:hypothetical protein
MGQKEYIQFHHNENSFPLFFILPYHIIIDAYVTVFNVHVSEICIRNGLRAHVDLRWDPPPKSK